MTAINHIVFMVQENRSLDSTFGALREYWAENGYPDESFDGLPQFNPVIGEAPLQAPDPAIPGCNPDSPAPKLCLWDPKNQIPVEHYKTICTMSPSNGWNAEHEDWDYHDPLGLEPAQMNGFVFANAKADRINKNTADSNGLRGMGYFDGDDLNYYYFMASNFATSDRWFQPVLSLSSPNRAYLISGTSQGYVWANNVNQNQLLSATTIFQELESAGISWKIYVDTTNACTGPPYDPNCLVSESIVHNFVWGLTIATKYPQHVVPMSQYFTDLENGTLPQVVQIESAASEGLDEHPPGNVQKGAEYVSTLINALMQSTSWKDSVFILSYDESGGYYDHVSPQPEPSPDGIKPRDFFPTDECARQTGPICDFVYSGYRLPLIVISPFAKKHYVSHTVADLTAILKLIETRYNLPPLTKRDAAQMDMTEFFDFNDPPWMTPPSPPAQNLDGVCNRALLP